VTTPLFFSAPPDDFQPTTYTVLVGEVRSGKVYTELPIFDGGASMQLNRGGDISVRVKWDADLGISLQDLKSRSTPGRMFLALVNDFHIVEAGPIWRRTCTSDGVLTIGANGLWSLFYRRGMWNTGIFNLQEAAADVDMTGLSDHGIINEMVYTAYSHGAFPYSFTIAAAGSSTEVYPGWELASVGERLEQFTARGPDTLITAQFTDTSREQIKWVVNVGDPYLEQVGIDHVWDIPGPDVLDVSIEEEGTNLASTVFVKGDGQERGTIIGRATNTSLTDNGYPVLHKVISDHMSVRDPNTATEYAQAYVNDYAYGKANELWTVRVRANGEVPLYSIRPGNRVRFAVGPNHWISEGEYVRRITGYTLQCRDDTLDLDIAPHWSEQ